MMEGSESRRPKNRRIRNTCIEIALSALVRRNFFSNRVVEAWNVVPGEIKLKRAKTVSSFKNAYRRHRENMVENA
jgi:hypothetical protein